jgi:hypothetical protein
MKRASTIVGILIAFGVTGFVGFWLVQPADPITEANYDLIQHGMTESDVEHLLRSSPGDNVSNANGSIHYKTWTGRSACISVVFLKQNDVLTVNYRFFHDTTTWERFSAWYRGRGIPSTRAGW